MTEPSHDHEALGSHTHPHTHPEFGHSHPEIFARLDAIEDSHRSGMEQLRTDVRADRDVAAAEAAAIAAAEAAQAAIGAAKDSDSDGEDIDESDIEIEDGDAEDSDEDLEPPPAPVMSKPPAESPAKKPGWFDRYPASKK